MDKQVNDCPLNHPKCGLIDCNCKMEQSNKSAEETLPEVMARYKDQEPKDFGNGMRERCYPVTAVVDIVGERTAPLKSRITQLEAENFNLAAYMCDHPYGDDYGHKRCLYQDRITQLEAREKMLTETLLNVRNRHMKAVTTYRIITKALNNEK